MGSLLANILLVQSFFPNRTVYYGFNSVSWFLSALLFCYYLTPCGLKLIEKMSRKQWKENLVFAFLLFLLKAVLESIFIYCGIEDDLYEFIFYIMPASRFLDYFAGMFLGKALLQYKNDLTKADVSIISAWQFVLLFVYCLVISQFQTIHWMNVPAAIAALFIFSVAVDSGVISQILSHPVLTKWQKVAMPFYLLHTPIIRYVNILLLKTLGEGFWHSLCLPVLSLLITAACSVMWNTAHKRVEFIKKNKNGLVSLHSFVENQWNRKERK